MGKSPSQSFKLTLENQAEYIDYSYVILSSVEMLVSLLMIFLLYIRGELKETLVAIILYFHMVIDSNTLLKILLDLTYTGFHSRTDNQSDDRITGQ